MPSTRTRDAGTHRRNASHSEELRCRTDKTKQEKVITAELQVDRVEFGMTWSPLHMASMTAVGTVKARFTRV
jgi:polyisoprenoid-binding protein YceI